MFSYRIKYWFAYNWTCFAEISFSFNTNMCANIGIWRCIENSNRRFIRIDFWYNTTRILGIVESKDFDLIQNSNFQLMTNKKKPDSLWEHHEYYRDRQSKVDPNRIELLYYQAFVKHENYVEHMLVLKKLIIIIQIYNKIFVELYLHHQQTQNDVLVRHLESCWLFLR